MVQTEQTREVAQASIHIAVQDSESVFCFIPHDESETSTHLPTEKMICISNLKLKNLSLFKVDFFSFNM